MSGLPEIDVKDWETNTEYNGYNTDMDIIKVCIHSFVCFLFWEYSKVDILYHNCVILTVQCFCIQWFWEIVNGFDKKELATLLQFVTGRYIPLKSLALYFLCIYSSRVPLGGFANLVGASGLTKFTVSRLDYCPNKLPMASTW